MASYFEKSKDIKFMETKVSIKSNMSTANLEVLEQLSIELLNN
jgi:hypothetical protein